VLRLGAWWSDLEPGPPGAHGHGYAWSDTDQWVSALASHGIRWEPLVSFSATWDSAVPGDYNAYPASPTNFAEFAGALARRYGPGGSFWAEHPELQPLPVQAYEIWNEPNADRFSQPQPASAPERYADLYAAARAALHQADPGARAVVGGLAAPANGVISAAEFLQRMVAHRPDLRGNIDAVGYHPYSPTPAGVYSQLASFRHALDSAAGPGVPIELTEIGWSSADLSLSAIASGLADLATTLPRSGCGVDRVMPYDWIGPEGDSGDREQWFGVYNHDGSPKPSGAAYAGAVQQMRGPSAPTGGVSICDAAPPVSRAPSGPRLRLKIVRDRRHRGRLKAVARCPAGCRLRFDVTPARAPIEKAGAAPLLAHRTLRFSRRVRRISLRIPPKRAGYRVRVQVAATARDGRRTVRTRTLRVR
jgi:hypothetical protein